MPLQALGRDIFVSLVFFFLGISLDCLSVFCLFYIYRVFEGLHGEKNPWRFPRGFRKDQGKEGHGEMATFLLGKLGLFGASQGLFRAFR